MKFKSKKSKVLAGILATGMVASVGTAFANTNAGDQLKSWYDTQFGVAKKALDDNTVSYGTQAAYAYLPTFNNLKTGAGTSIANKQDLASSAAQSDVNAAKKGHLDRVAQERANALNSYVAQFDQILKDNKQLIDTTSTQAFNVASAELVKVTGPAGTQALADLKTEIEATQASAVSEVEAAIAAAKADLKAALDSEQATTKGEIEYYANTVINKLKEDIQKKVNELVAAQELAIQKEADRLEGVAVQAIQDAVNAEIAK